MIGSLAIGLPLDDAPDAPLDKLVEGGIEPKEDVAGPALDEAVAMDPDPRPNEEIAETVPDGIVEDAPGPKEEIAETVPDGPVEEDVPLNDEAAETMVVDIAAVNAPVEEDAAVDAVVFRAVLFVVHCVAVINLRLMISQFVVSLLNLAWIISSKTQKIACPPVKLPFAHVR